MDISSISHTAISADLSRVFVKYQLISGDNTQLIQDSTELRGHDTVNLSQEGQNLSRVNSSKEIQSADNVSKNSLESLNKQELAQLRALKERDVEVHTHEQAHLAAAGQYSRGSASFTYQKGPDGLTYAVEGEVEIDMTQEKAPEDTIKKMQTIKRAALAPTSPSAADRSIASKASAIEAEARHEEALQIQEELLQLNTPRNPATGYVVSKGHQP
jgi:hypothetical protein